MTDTPIRAKAREAAKDRSPTLSEPERSKEWALDNVYTLARREIKRLTRDKGDPVALERWQHALRICESAGCEPHGVLRRTFPTELTEGAAPVSPAAQPEEHHGHRQEQATTGATGDGRSDSGDLYRANGDVAVSTPEVTPLPVRQRIEQARESVLYRIRRSSVIPQDVDDLIAAVRAESAQEIERLKAELSLRRSQMSAFPFCPDHRDKVLRADCYACRLEAAEAELSRLKGHDRA